MNWCAHCATVITKQLLKMSQSRPLFVYFVLFHYNFNNTNWKKHRCCARDSNPRPQDGRRRLNHGAMAASPTLQLVPAPKINSSNPCQESSLKRYNLLTWLYVLNRPIYASFSQFSSFLFDLFLCRLIVNKLPMTGLEPRFSGAKSNRSTNCATTTA